MGKIQVWLLFVIIALAGASPSFAQTSQELEELRQAIEALTEGQKVIQQDLQEIKRLLRTRPTQAPSGDEDLQNITLNVDGALFKGEKNARLTLVDFTDYQ